jgi:APA family basic amino acid/polyamine antiporter
MEDFEKKTAVHEITEGRPPMGVQRKPGESLLFYKLRCTISTTNVEYMLSTIKNNKLKRSLNVWHLIGLGVGTTIGTGIYVLPGIIAAKHAGPGVVLSFIFAAIAAFFSALSYAELSSMIPVAGSSYTYLYATMGEIVAWIVGWTLVLEFLIGAAAVSVGWSGYLLSLIKVITKNPDYTSSFATSPLSYSDKKGFYVTDGYFNFPAAFVAIFCTIFLMVGTKESSNFTAMMVAFKVAVILLFVFGACDHVNTANFVPFIPSGEGMGIGGVFKGASMAFFAYSGFEVIANASQECKNPGRNLPLSLVSSLAICTILYVSVCLVMVGVVPYPDLNVSYPVSVAIKATGRTWLDVMIILGAVLGMTTAIIGCLLSQSRIFYSMSRDGLLPKIFSKVHPKRHTPYVNNIILGLITVVAAGVLPIDVLAELSGISTLVAFFFVNLVVPILRYKRPELERGFKVPLGGYFLPIIGAIVTAVLIGTADPQTILRVFIWIVLGLVIYFCYGLHYSKLNNPHRYSPEELNDADQIDTAGGH